MSHDARTWDFDPGFDDFERRLIVRPLADVLRVAERRAEVLPLEDGSPVGATVTELLPPEAP